MSNEHAWRQLEESPANKNSTFLFGDATRTVNALEAVETLLELGADATLVDNAGNDAIDHCNFGYFELNITPSRKTIDTLRNAGAKGSPATLELFSAIRNENLAKLQKAITDGADINRASPPAFGFTPLTFAAGHPHADALELIQALLNAGADPNKRCRGDTALMRAVRGGKLSLPVVKELVAAGADIHAVYECGETIENAYSAAGNQVEVRHYLRSLGADNPKRPGSKPLKPGVQSWNNFNILLIKTSIEKAAEALAKIISGKVHLNIYGQTFTPGERAYLVLKLKGMDWCNIIQTTPPLFGFEKAKKTEVFAAELAKVAGASVFSVECGLTVDKASVVRIEPDGRIEKDKGWDCEPLKEMLVTLGDEAPAWAKKQLAYAAQDNPTSSERLVMIAEHEKFIVDDFHLYSEPGEKLNVEFPSYGSESFDNTAFVNS